MPYEVRVLDQPHMGLAVVRGVARADNLSPKVMELFDEVYQRLAKSTVRQKGLNVVVYQNEAGQNLLASPKGCPIEVGVQVAAPFTSNAGLIYSATPEGAVATVAHYGPYVRLGEAHEAIQQWSTIHHRLLAGPCWEVYGHWTDDPVKLRTDVFYLLRG